MRRRRRLTVALVLAAAACGGGRAPDRAATERMFLETCAPGGEPEQVAVCECAFERLTEDLSDEELEDLDQSVRGDPEELPDEVVEAALACAAEPLTPPTSKPDQPGDVTTTTEREP